MTYRVVIQPSAGVEIEQAYLRIALDAPDTATRWYNDLLVAIESLASFPLRCSLAPEDEAFNVKIRHLLYGRKRRRYRALFTIAKDTVHVLHFRHWAQRPMTRDEVKSL